MNLKPFVVRYLAYNIFLALPPLYLQLNYPGSNLLIPYFWAFFIVSAVMNMGVYIFSVRGMQKSPESSIKYFMGGTGLKFFFWMIIVFVYLYNTNVNSHVFILDFFYIYLFHTVFEISSLLLNLRNQNLR